MCSVQVLLFAEAMRSGAGRRNALRPGGGVCRKLFSNESAGDSDPSRVLRQMEQQLRQRERERWNFDFEKEKPLPGRYEWVRVTSNPAASSPGTCAIADASSEENTPAPRGETSGTTTTTAGNRRNCAGTQAKITDFLRRRKRAAPEVSPLKSKKARRNALPGRISSTRLR